MRVSFVNAAEDSNKALNSKSGVEHEGLLTLKEILQVVVYFDWLHVEVGAPRRPIAYGEAFRREKLDRFGSFLGDVRLFDSSFLFVPKCALEFAIASAA